LDEIYPIPFIHDLLIIWQWLTFLDHPVGCSKDYSQQSSIHQSKQTFIFNDTCSLPTLQYDTICHELGVWENLVYSITQLACLIKVASNKRLLFGRVLELWFQPGFRAGVPPVFSKISK